MTDKLQPESMEPEDKEPNASSRRKFLLGAATLAAGAVTTDVATAGAGACGTAGKCEAPTGGVIVGPDGKIQCCTHPDATEALKYHKVMWRAAWDSTYRERLLTFGEAATSVDWSQFDQQKRDTMLGETLAALREESVPLDPMRLYVVLSSKQFDDNVYFMKDACEVVLRLPNSLCMPYGNAAFLAQVSAQMKQAGDPKQEGRSPWPESLDFTEDVKQQIAVATIQSHVCGM